MFDPGALDPVTLETGALDIRGLGSTGVPMFCFAWFRRRSRNQSRPASMAKPATPPTTPPAIAPVLDDDEDELSDALVGVVASEVVVVVVALEIALDIVDDGKAVEVVPVDGWSGIQFTQSMTL